MEFDALDLARIRQVVHQALPLLADRNVGLIDFGLQRTRGVLTGGLAVRCHVLKKFPGELALEAALERGDTSVDLREVHLSSGYPIDVIEGRYQLASWGWPLRVRPRGPRAARHNPLRAGISTSGAYLRGYGTLGGKVIDRASGAEMLLTNWHVLVGEWWPRTRRPVYQPGRGDGGGPADTVGFVTRHAMDFGIDAAVAELSGARALINDQLDLGPVTGLARPALGMALVKSGRASGVTAGVITGVEGVQSIRYSGIDRLIRHVLAIDPPDGFSEVSRPGDSGSFWLEQGRRAAVGLHFAGGNAPERALAIDMQAVLDALDVELALAPAAQPTALRASLDRPLPASSRPDTLPPTSVDEPELSPQLVAAIERAALQAELRLGPQDRNGIAGSA